MKKLLLILTTIFFLTVAFGQTWTPINSPTHKTIFRSSFVSQDTGWVVCGPAASGPGDSIYKTTNGGITWTLQNFPPPPPNDIRFFTSVHFINSNVGIISCGNYLYTGVNPALVSTILWTNDGGNNWVYKDLGSQDDYVNDARLASPTTAYAVGQYGQGKKTSDGGTTWTTFTYTGQYSGVKLFSINQDTIYFSGLDNFNLQGAFGKTKTGGSSWNVSTISVNTSMQAIYFHDYLKGWVAGYSGLVKYTNDGGVSWTYGNTGISGLITDIAFTDAFNGWGVVNNGKIIRTSDGGLNWNVEYNGTIPLNSIVFTKPNNIGYAVGDSGRILKYTSTVGIKNINKTFESTISPNPFSIQTTLRTLNIFKDATLTVYNSLGQTVKQISNLSGQTITLNRDNLPSGLYFSTLTQGDNIIALDKLVIIDN